MRTILHPVGVHKLHVRKLVAIPFGHRRDSLIRHERCLRVPAVVGDTTRTIRWIAGKPRETTTMTYKGEVKHSASNCSCSTRIHLVAFQIVAMILCDTGVALLAYMDGITKHRTLNSVILAALSAAGFAIYKVGAYSTLVIGDEANFLQF